MNAQLRRAAKACLFSTVTGMILVPESFALADAPSRIRHADAAEEVTITEPSPLATLGEARPIPTPTDATPSASHKMVAPTKPKAKAKTKAAAKQPAKAPAVGATKATAPATAKPSGGSRESEGIEQTGALFGRSTGGQRPAAPATQQRTAPTTQPQPASSQSAVERELEELYRKNGRQMPEMNMQELQVPQAESLGVQPQGQPTLPGPAASQGQTGYGNYPGGTSQNGSYATTNNQNGSPNNYQNGTRATKPNFFERIFGFGRSRSKASPRPSTQQTPRNAPQSNGSSSTGASSYGPYVPGSTRPTPPATSYRQPQNSTYAPTSPQSGAPLAAAPQTATPAQRPQTLPMREPTPLAPVTPQYQPSGSRSARGLNGADGQPLIDESAERDDSESLDLSQDEGTGVSRTPPQILPKQTANGSAESPYTGLKITPNESEDSIAHSDELDKTFNTDLVPTAPSAATTSAKSVEAKGGSAAPESALRHPLAQPSKSIATPPALPSKTASKSDEDELMELDDEDEDEDDDEEDRASKSPKTPAETPKTTPVEEKPIYRRQTAGTPAATTPAANSTGSAGPAASGEPVKLAAVAAPRGFKGFCPVILKDERRLIEARAQFKSEYRGRTYTFSSLEAKATFDESPEKYAPARDGADVVRLASGEEGVEGSLEHAAWYRGKLYLFSSDASRREFVDTPSRFKVNE